MLGVEKGREDVCVTGKADAWEWRSSSKIRLELSNLAVLLPHCLPRALQRSSGNTHATCTLYGHRYIGVTNQLPIKLRAQHWLVWYAALSAALTAEVQATPGGFYINGTEMEVTVWFYLGYYVLPASCSSTSYQRRQGETV